MRETQDTQRGVGFAYSNAECGLLGCEYNYAAAIQSMGEEEEGHGWNRTQCESGEMRCDPSN